MLLDTYLSTDSIDIQIVLHKESYDIYRIYGEIPQTDFLVFLWVFFEGSNQYGKYITSAGY